MEGTNLAHLPVEVLHEIVSYIRSDTQDLLRCTSVCRSLSDVALTHLYKTVDFNCEGNEGDNNSRRKTKSRQLRLLKSISENPSLGALVKEFKNYLDAQPIYTFMSRGFDDPTQNEDTELAVNAAKVMKNISRAEFSENPLAGQVINNLSSYTQLVDLHIRGFQPEEHIWRNMPVSLKTLKWEIPAVILDNRTDYKPWDIAQFLIDVAAATCPGLVSLDILVDDISTGSSQRRLPDSTRYAQEYQGVAPGTSILGELRHFSYSSVYWPGIAGKTNDLLLLEFISKHPHLCSVSIGTDSMNQPRSELDRILEITHMLPNLTTLTLRKSTTPTGTEITRLQFWSRLIKAISSPNRGIESFNGSYMGCAFSPQIGILFQSWNNLKFLRLGDIDNEDGPYSDDGRLNFFEYRPELLGFIRSLPQSLEELYIEINGERLIVYEDEDFDPMCDLGIPAFQKLRRLHTFDIHAWISDVDRGAGKYPEKAVFYRRLPRDAEYSDINLNKSSNTQTSHLAAASLPASGGPQAPGHESDPRNKGLKNIWTSRMDCVYQEERCTVTTKVEQLAGEFDGKDAEMVWGGGYTYKKVRRGTGRGIHPDDVYDSSWPFWYNPIKEYKMWKQRR